MTLNPPTATPPYRDGYTTLFMNVVVPFVEESMIQDQVYDAVPLFSLVTEAGNVERKRLGHTWLEKVNLSKGPTAQPFKYYADIEQQNWVGSSAAKVSPANYVIPFQISWEEVAESTTEDAISDMLMELMEKLYLGFRDTIATDFYAGNSGNSERMLGLEQLCFPVTHTDSGFTTSNNINQRILYREQLRQANNAYLGLQRAAWTSTTGGGTGWEPLTLNMDPGATGAGFALSSGSKNNDLKRFDEFCDFLTWGNEFPDTMIFTPAPYADLENAMWEKTNVERDAHAFTGLELRVSHFSYRGAIVIKDEMARTKNTIGNASTSTPENIYVFPLRRLKYCVDPDAEFTPQPWKPGANNLAYTQDVVLRCQLYANEPRRFGRGFNYPT